MRRTERKLLSVTPLCSVVEDPPKKRLTTLFEFKRFLVIISFKENEEIPFVHSFIQLKTSSLLFRIHSTFLKLNNKNFNSYSLTASKVVLRKDLTLCTTLFALSIQAYNFHIILLCYSIKPIRILLYTL